MADLTPATPIRLSKDNLETLSRAVQNLVTDLETQSAPLLKAMEIWEKNYEATPRHTVKNYPFANASNIVVPLIKTMVDSRVASTWETIHSFGEKVWMTRLLNETFEDQSKTIARVLNWQADGNDFDFGPTTYDWLLESTIHGSSVLAGNWRTNQSHVYMKDGNSAKAVPIAWNTGPILEHVPRYQILWDTSYPSIGEAPAVGRQFPISWATLSAFATQSDGWIKENVEDVKNAPGLDGPTAKMQKSQDLMDHRNTQKPTGFELHDIREVTVSWPQLQALDIRGADLALPGNKKIDTVTVDIRVTIHRKTGKILRLTSQPYYYPGKPFFDTFFHKRVGRGHSVGMAKILEQPQAGITTVLNQGIDAQTRANSVWGKTNVRELQEQPIDMAKWIWDPTMKGVEPFNLAGSSFSNIQLIQTIQSWAERLSGQSDPAFGRETRLGGHSAPATTTLALLERGNTLAAPDRGLLQRQLGRAGEFISTLNQQFGISKLKLQQVLGEKDAEKAIDIYYPEDPIPGNYKFSIRGLSRSDNPDQEMQKQITIDQQNQNYWGNIARYTEAWSQTLQMAPPEHQEMFLEAYGQAIKGMTFTYKRFLEAAEVDDIENFIMTLPESMNGNGQSAQLDQFADRARQSAGTQPDAQGPGAMAPAGIPAPNGAAGPPGAVG